MNKKHVPSLSVTLGGHLVGMLGADANGRIFFEYDSAWLAGGFDLAPYTMQFAPGLQAAHDNTFDGLHGPFADSLPDGWGLPLMNRALKREPGWSPHEITMLDRLAFIGKRAMGALEYHPEIDLGTEPPFDLARLAEQAVLVLEGSLEEVARSLVIHGGSPGGARPKVTVALRETDGACMSGNQTLPAGFEHWLVKFRSKDDPIDSGRIEKAYAAMAALAGLHMPPTRLIETAVNGVSETYFAVKRFDREGDARIHMLSMSGHLHASHRMPSLDYEGVIAATRRLTQSAAEARKAFLLMVFNTVAHNRDDHAKNFAFLHTNAGWSLSPPFDLTMSAGMGGQHTTAINGSGNPTRKDIEQVAAFSAIGNAGEVLDAVLEAAGHWKRLASEFGVSRAQTTEIGEAIEGMRVRVGLKAGAKPGRR